MLSVSIDCKIKTDPTPSQHRRKCSEWITAHCTHVIITEMLLACAFEPTDPLQIEHVCVCVCVCWLCCWQSCMCALMHTAHNNQPLCKCSACVCMCVCVCLYSQFEVWRIHKHSRISFFVFSVCVCVFERFYLYFEDKTPLQVYKTEFTSNRPENNLVQINIGLDFEIGDIK